MSSPLYQTGEFARRARVSVRTLRFYDRMGLLTPAEHSLSGHRRYTDEDLVTLEKILGLKLLGFSLNEIKAFLSTEPETFAQVLSQQRAMLETRRSQIAQAIRTIDEVENQVRAGTWDWNSILRVIEAMQMNEDRSEVLKHLTPEQIEAIEDISARSYPPEAWAEHQKSQAWSEADQAQLTEEWNAVYAEAERLAAAGADPTAPEGKALGERYKKLLEAFTGGNPEIMESLQKFYAEAKELPPEKNPYGGATWEAMSFAEKAYEAVK